MTGATFTLTAFSEHEECRHCLEPGLKRRCCGNYYCDECYYSSLKCRSCAKPVMTSGVLGVSRAEAIAVFLGWLTSIFFFVSVFAFFVTLAASEVQTPKSLSDFKCFGFFRKCDVPVCIGMNISVAMGNSPLPKLSEWKNCELDSLAKLQSKACVYDSELYALTDKLLGYDVCVDSFQEGLYIFEDTFEYWNKTFQKNLMKSALWENIVNGHPSDVCGVPAFQGGSGALVFSGLVYRFAETVDLDVSSGGWLEAELFIAPNGWDVSKEHCKTNYAGSIFIEYSVDSGKVWNLLAKYESWVWRQENFFRIQLPVPQHGQTNRTRFRFNQPEFQAARDAWAVDNVRVFRYFPTAWQSKPDYISNVDQARKELQEAQCCLDTDWCETRLSSADTKKCKKYPWYHGQRYLLRNSELVVCIVTFISLMKFFYTSSQEWLVRNRFPFQDEFEELTKWDRLMKLLPARYRPKRNISAYVSNVHLLARLGDEVRDCLEDGEGDGDRKQQLEELKLEKAKRREKRERKKRRKLEKRNKYLSMKSNRFAKDKADEIDRQPDSESSSSEEEEVVDKTKFGTEQLASEVDKIKRQNLGMLRIPFDLKVSISLRQAFVLSTLLVITIEFLFLVSTMKFYVVFQHIEPFGIFSGSIVLNSYGILLFALYGDVKEIYFTLKYVILARKEWVPMVTLDKSEEVNSLFVGPHAIPLANIKAISIFPKAFTILCCLGYFLGCYPWCIFSLILRNQYLDFPKMRVVTPIIGGIVIARGILGPGFLVKIGFSFYYLVAYNMHTREKIGLACSAEKTKNLAYNVALAFALVGGFGCALVEYNWTVIFTAACFAFGFLFGIIVGFTHELPIHPWMYLTCLEEGMCIVLKKQQKCPCLYWGKYCTEMNEICEVFMAFTNDDVKFINFIKSGASLA